MSSQNAMIGVKYPDKYAVEETFQLFKIPWEWYDPEHNYDVIIARREEIGNVDVPVIDLSEKDYFGEIARTLNEGLPHCHEPVVDILIDELRQILKEHTLLVEIPPVPWGYSYIVALTHDVDITSVRERRWVSVGYAVYQCLRKGMFKDAFQILGAKCGVGKDPWNCFEEWMRVEEELGVKSTFFFLPFTDCPGKNAPNIRAGHYKLNPEIVNDLIKRGWEVGVHGIDNWTDIRQGKKELMQISKYTNTEPGTRVHWLMFDEKTWEKLDQSGYCYDTTFGYNEDVGFRSGTVQVFQPRGCKNLLELPLEIEDMALFSRFCWVPSDNNKWDKIPCLNLSQDGALTTCNFVLDYHKKYGGVVTLLWHHVSLAPPNDWGNTYRDLVGKGLDDGAWVVNAGKVIEWFQKRRMPVLKMLRKNNCFTIQIDKNPLEDSDFPFVLRIHSDNLNLENISGNILIHEKSTDILCDLNTYEMKDNDRN